MKKILVISHEFPPNGGGAGVVIQDIINNLQNKYQIDLVINFDNIERNGLYNIIKVRTIPKIRFLNYWIAIRKMNLETYDRIILNDIGAAMIACYFFSEKILNRSVFYLHGNEVEEIFLSNKIWFKILNFKNKYKMALSNSYKVIAVSEFMKKKFLEKTGLSSLANKIEVIYNGVNEEIFYYDTKFDIKKEHNISSQNKILLSVSRLIKQKGYDIMFDEFIKISKIDNNIVWIIIGEGNYKKELEKKIKDNNLLDKILLLGHVERNCLRYYYSQSNLFWLFSRLEESLGLVYIEAEFCNLLVLAGDHSGIREAILNGETGLLIEEEADICKNILYALNLLMNEESLREIKGKFGMKENIERLESLIL